MRPEHTDMNELEYLAGLGFERTPITEADLQDLKKKIRGRSFSYNSGIYFSLISLLAGVFLGITLFFVVYKPVPEKIAVEPESIVNKLHPAVLAVEKEIVLDTVMIVKENFVSPKSLPVIADSMAEALPAPADPVVEIPVKTIDASVALNSPLREEKIRFIANAPVVYIHGMKVTDYTTLYFKKNQFVRVGGVAAAYNSSSEARPEALHLKESAGYYLHEELAGALLHFKKGRYDACQRLLELVATYNKTDINCDFYRGMCCYYKKNYTAAIAFFDPCITNLNNTFLQEARYYKAVCLSESGQTEEATALFKEIAAEGEFYAEKARVYLSSK